VRDVQHILSIGFQAFFYLSPIIYPTEILPQGLQKIFLFNPFYYFIQSFRYPIYYNKFPPLLIWGVTFFLAVVFLGLGLWVFYKKEENFVFQLS
jgi:ABC-type polysaccharide/polyol phosphate export permease